jgi:hypothetical protein
LNYGRAFVVSITPSCWDSLYSIVTQIAHPIVAETQDAMNFVCALLFFIVE